MGTPRSFGRDTGLQVRMLVVIVGLGLVYAVLIGALLLAGAQGITILAIGGGLALFQFFASEKLALRAMGAREVTAEEAPELHAMIARLATTAGIPMPKVAVAATPMPNAFAMGRSKSKSVVCATTGIMETLTAEELEGVMAHEVTHIVNRDVMTMTLAGFFASIASMIVQFGLFFGGGFGGGGGDSEDNSSMLGGLALVAIGAVVWIVSFFLMMALSRYREFAADRGAAEITGRPMALASALQKIAGGNAHVPRGAPAHSEMNAFYIFPAGAKQSLFSLFSTHPPMEKRIAALTKLDNELRGTSAIFNA
ncbi:MAG TPA: zinc metalloprotease HtpX [Baekduia sp.]|nr:zinc metalloprotease HtpX [Baekduia sp.]